MAGNIPCLASCAEQCRLIPEIRLCLRARTFQTRNQYHFSGAAQYGCRKRTPAESCFRKFFQYGSGFRHSSFPVCPLTRLHILSGNAFLLSGKAVRISRLILCLSDAPGDYIFSGYHVLCKHIGPSASYAVKRLPEILCDTGDRIFVFPV